MPLLERLLLIGPIRKTIWRLWYPFLTRRLQQEGVHFLNYAYDDGDPPGGTRLGGTRLDLDPKDERNRYCIQLYNAVLDGNSLQGLKVLEVSCGHGGGAEWLTRTHRPESYQGLDLNPSGIRYCRATHSAKGLEFLVGDAQRLPFKDHSLDRVINVEASHCYPDFGAFLAEVHRVLQPGGLLFYTDFRFADQLDGWQPVIEASDLEIVHSRDITAEVARGMDRQAEPNRALVERALPTLLHSLGNDFAAVPGGRVHQAIQSGKLQYRMWQLRKPAP